MRYLNESKNALHEVIYFEKQDPASRLHVEVAMQYNDSYNETLLSFANNINNHDGGTHLSGFKTALTITINRRAEAAGWIKETRPTGDDLREGLIAIISTKLSEPSFESQTKDKLLNTEVEGFVSAAVSERLGAFLEEHPKEAHGQDLREGDDGSRRRAKPPARRANSPAARTALKAAHCPASSPTVAADLTKTPSCSWSKEIRPAAQPSRGAIPTYRASSPCAANC